jgi:phenylalanyl-tRNA synthetase beta chain
VVCGAPNCRAGITTVYVPPGAKLGALEIEKIAISGVESDGMLVSGAELGLNRDHNGILEIVDGVFDLKPDHIIEIDNKSLTHRPDLWGHFGMAREVAALTGGSLRDPVDLNRIPRGDARVRVEIQNYDLCPRYSALVFENVTVQPSPLWLQARLEAIGLNPILNIVDVTNYVMAELAQPMHAFDADKLQGGVIYARPATQGERILALNEEAYDLTAANLVIADADGPIAIAGVIGGAESAISAATKRIVLESANFQAASIRKTSSALKLRTDASMRFEKSQDPVNTVRALARAVELLEIVSPGIRLAGGLADAYREKPAPAPILLPLEWLNRKLGRAVAKQEVRRILEALEFGVDEVQPDVFSVSVPTWRATKDISMKDDLVEEVGRMIGYDSITPRPPLLAATVPPMNEERAFHHGVRDLMVDNGFTEVYNYSFVSDEAAARFGFAPDDHVRVKNPIAADQNLLRASLLPNIWKNIVENSKHFDSFRLFEIGQEIHKRASGLADEAPHLAAAMYSKSDDGVANLFELKRVAECLLPGVSAQPAQARAYEHPARTANLAADGTVIARLFELHPSLVETGRAAILDIDLRQLERVTPKDKRYTAIRRYPTSVFDLSVMTPLRTPVGDIQGLLAELAGASLASIEYLRQYTGAPLPEDSKSVSFRLTVGAADRTLSSDEAGAIRQKIIDGMRGRGYELRV